MRLLKLNGCFLLQRFGMTGLVPCSRRSSRSSALSYALSPSIRFDGFTLRTRRSATGQSCASPVVNRMAIRRPLTSASAKGGSRSRLFAGVERCLAEALGLGQVGEVRALDSLVLSIMRFHEP